MAKRRKDNTIKERDNAMAKRRKDNTMAKRRKDNIMAKRKTIQWPKERQYNGQKKKTIQ
jgi:hypothetical protein